MRKLIAICLAGLTLTACASTDVSGPSLKDSIRNVERQSGEGLDHQLALANAQADYEAERYGESFDGFQLISLRLPQNITARIGWGNAAIALNLFEKAYDVFSNRSNLDSASPAQKHDFLAGFVIAEVATQRADDDEVRLNAALEYNLDDTRLWNALGRFHDTQEQWRPAQRTYMKALNASPKAQPSVVNNLGMSFLKQGRYERALEKFERAVQLKPMRGLYDNNRRMTLALMANYEAATDKASHDRASNIFNDAGYIALTQKKYEAAEKLLTRAIEISPSYNPYAESNLEQLKTKLEDLSVQLNMPFSNAQNAQEPLTRDFQDWGELWPSP